MSLNKSRTQFEHWKWWQYQAIVGASVSNTTGSKAVYTLLHTVHQAITASNKVKLGPQVSHTLQSVLSIQNYFITHQNTADATFCLDLNLRFAWIYCAQLPQRYSQVLQLWVRVVALKKKNKFRKDALVCQKILCVKNTRWHNIRYTIFWLLCIWS